MAALDRPDYTEDLWLVGQDVDIEMVLVDCEVTLDINIIHSDITLDINIASSAVTLDINIASSAVTLDINIASSAVTLDINIATCAATLDISVTAQTVDLDINLEGPTGGYAVEIGSDFALYQQPYSRRSQTSTTGADVDCTADTRYTLTNSTHFYYPAAEIYCSAACTIKLECLIGADYWEVGEIVITTGGRSIHQIRDMDGNVLRAWKWGNLYYTPDADTTIRFRLSHLP